MQFRITIIAGEPMDEETCLDAIRTFLYDAEDKKIKIFDESEKMADYQH